MGRPFILIAVLIGIALSASPAFCERDEAPEHTSLEASQICLTCSGAGAQPAPVAADTAGNLTEISHELKQKQEPAAIPAASVRASQRTQRVPRKYYSRQVGAFNPDLPASRFFGKATDANLAGRRSSLIDAPRNPYVREDLVNNLIRTALNHRHAWSIGECWISIRKALVDSKLVGSNVNLRAQTPRARVAALKTAGFRNIVDANLMKHPEDAPKGAVLVYEVNGAPNLPGDAQIRTDHGFVSDWFWPTAYTHQSIGSGRAHLIGVMVGPIAQND
jgi:hypothetical protein